MNIMEHRIFDIMLTLDKFHENMAVTLILPVSLHGNGRKFCMFNFNMTIHFSKGLAHHDNSLTSSEWIFNLMANLSTTNTYDDFIYFI